ncbi:MAG TPA: type II toxin-antitoxin system RelE/ParE family toxin [Burkholderiaceae bacterium]
MTYKLHPAAEAELTHAVLYYAKEASSGIALAFLGEFERVAEWIQANPQLGTPSRHGLRVYPFRRFPHSIVYRESAGGPLIYAVTHHRQRPGYWLGRL